MISRSIVAGAKIPLSSEPMKITLGFSPCPNDTYMFAALVNGWIDPQGLDFDIRMTDVETLNEWAGTENPGRIQNQFQQGLIP